MPTPKRSMTVVQSRIESSKYVIQQMKNMTDYSIGSAIKKAELDRIIQEGTEVIVKGGAKR